ncbi:hypothetical protein [Kribbella kalugense]|nr:hypothetical protein [Kribbella kalugense]
MADRFDLDAIEADDALLDLLAAGGESARAAGEYDSAVQLLADLRLAVEVEDELPVETIDDPESFLARCAALNPITDPFARKLATRGLALGVAAVAALSVSGVAAAVNGDPLSPYEKVIEKMVDAVRPQTSFPKEDLDGLPVMDRTKIVKVGKNYKETIQAQHAAQADGKGGVTTEDPAAAKDDLRPPLAKPVVEDKALAELDRPTIPVQVKTEDPGKTVVDPTKPADDKTDPPTDTNGDGTDTTVQPTTPPDTPTPTPPPDTPDPTGTTTTDPTDGTSTTTPPNVETGTGDTTGDPTSTPTTTPTGQTDGTGSDGTGSGDTAGPGDTTTPGDSSTAGDDQKTQVPGDGDNPVSDLINQLLPVLPTPTGEPVTVESAKLFFGESQAAKPPTAKKAVKKAAKHSSGKVTSGSVKKAYPKGKHSSGQYPEGKHAAIARTHGSTTDAAVLTILGIVNTPIK